MSRNYEHKDYSIIRFDNEVLRDRVKALKLENKALKEENEKLKNEWEDIFVKRWHLCKGDCIQEQEGTNRKD